MSERLEVRFPGGKRIDVEVGGFVIHTDQGAKAGGAGSAPEPFALFLASLAACSGIYALNFCESRKLPTDGLGLAMDWSREPGAAQANATLRLRLPHGFPDRYRDSIVRAMDLCAVKKHIIDPPHFEILIED
ncbi:OsmC family protein [Thiococcus pfennigii]|jgi:ribosomal protein S12 methylthiotransferase accessory factor|uniref:OsmC family protein n=1 Tax=Thiococcus pfennigii TaxID=1057 RepID=UPI001903CFD3|nr:OsmC family protein [Thiococcus pfennigii]MBK1700167.1 osmotically inducible protein OsmC [Thiococcus pfennigii]MBK1731734.1 osmotically inducible protein OsmC [Thiococcus pfennigii]